MALSLAAKPMWDAISGVERGRGAGDAGRILDARPGPYAERVGAQLEVALRLLTLRLERMEEVPEAV